MTKRIFGAVCMVALCVFLASVVLFTGVLYEYFSNVQQRQLRMQTNLAAQGAANEGIGYFDGLDVNHYRITWIDTDGSVLYDSKSDYAEMENHMEREEIRQAISEGMGESARYSVTLMERSLYCARRLPDGTVIRISVAQNTLLSLIFGMLQPICIIFAAAVIVSMVLAFRLSREIVRPLNELDLDHPLRHEAYEELMPALRRIAAQQLQIRQQEEKLRQKKQEFETVTTGMAEGIVLLNEKRVILGINPAALRLLETDFSCVGNYIFSVNRSIKLQELLQEAENGTHAERIFELGGGSYQLNASPVCSDGLVSGVVLLIQDVTEKEKAEQMRREFTANVSHELKNPLHTISGYAELLANGMVNQENITDFSARIYTEAQRMIRLVEDIIRLSHLDEGAKDMNWEKLDLYELAEDAIQHSLPKANAMGITTELCGEPAQICGIRQLIQGILCNLCDNAIQYNHKGGSVLVTVRQEETGILLSVADTGMGIPKEHQERIFERFYRVDKSHSREPGGTGLGLSIVKHAVKLHHAEIELHSAAGEGTTVMVRFPAPGVL